MLLKFRFRDEARTPIQHATHAAYALVVTKAAAVFQQLLAQRSSRVANASGNNSDPEAKSWIADDAVAFPYASFRRSAAVAMF